MKLGLGASLLRGSFVSSGFDINSLSPELWLKFNEGQGAITDGKRWSDQSGNNRHAEQTTDAQEPTFSSGRMVTDGDSKDSLDLASTFTLAGEYYMFIVLHLSSENAETIISSNNNSTSFIRIGQGGVTNRVRVRNNGNTLQDDITMSTTFGTSEAILEVGRDGSNDIKVLKNGTVLGTGSAGGTYQFEQIGASSTGIQIGKIAEVVVFSSFLSSADATKVRNDIAERVGITI